MDGECDYDNYAPGLIAISNLSHLQYVTPCIFVDEFLHFERNSALKFSPENGGIGLFQNAWRRS